LHAYSLDSLLSQVNEDNLHQEIDLGNEVGKEIW
jgi:antitoxin component of MazEF toxin-antitoxin module